MKNKIIDYIQENKISSVEVSDALEKKGVLQQIKPINSGHFIVGEVEYVYTFNNSNWELHKQIVNIAEGKIVYVDTFNCTDRAVLGDIVSKYILLYKKAKAVVINGLARDIHRIKKENYPMWTKGYTPLGCFNKDVDITDEIYQKATQNKAKLQGSVLIADDSGCTVIEKESLTENFFNKLEFIELQEDIWYFCIDTLKMSTYETICLKQYLEKSQSFLPEPLKQKLNEFESAFKG